MKTILRLLIRPSPSKIPTLEMYVRWAGPLIEPMGTQDYLFFKICFLNTQLREQLKLFIYYKFQMNPMYEFQISCKIIHALQSTAVHFQFVFILIQCYISNYILQLHVMCTKFMTNIYLRKYFIYMDYIRNVQYKIQDHIETQNSKCLFMRKEFST